MKIALFFCLLLIASCGQKKATEELKVEVEEIKIETLAEKAEKHLPMVIDAFYPQAPNFKPEIIERDTIYSDDSLHITSFVMKYQNSFGGYSKGSFEYIFGLNKDSCYYYLLSPKKHLYSEFMSLYVETMNQPRNQNADSIKQLRMLHGLASLYCNTYNGGKFKE